MVPQTLLAAIADSGAASLVFRIRNEEPKAIAQAQGLAADPDAPLQERLTTIQALGEIQDDGPRETLLSLLSRSQEPEIQRAALVAVRRFADLEVATRILAHYSILPPDEQTVAQATLVSRPEWAPLVLDAIESGALPQGSVSAQAQAAMRRHDRPSLNRRIESLFPATLSKAPDRQARVRELVDQIGAAPGSPYRGRPLFLQRCASCHVLFHDGRAVGPELTSYQRDDLDSLLNAIVDPDFEIREGYEGVTLHLQDGRLQTGFIADRGSKVLTLRGFDGSRTSTPLNQVQRVVPLGRSLMPGGLIDDLTDQQRRDLIAYLRSDQPMLAD